MLVLKESNMQTVELYYIYVLACLSYHIWQVFSNHENVCFYSNQ